MPRSVWTTTTEANRPKRRTAIGSLPDDVGLVSERISSGTDELCRRGENGYLRIDVSGTLPAEEIVKIAESLREIQP